MVESHMCDVFLGVDLNGRPHFPLLYMYQKSPRMEELLNIYLDMIYICIRAIT
jgi:hypothetical protein